MRGWFYRCRFLSCSNWALGLNGPATRACVYRFNSKYGKGGKVGWKIDPIMTCIL